MGLVTMVSNPIFTRKGGFFVYKIERIKYTVEKEGDEKWTVYLNCEGTDGLTVRTKIFTYTRRKDDRTMEVCE